MATFAVTLEHGSGWDSLRPVREQDDWDAHAEFMDGLVTDGFIVVGGPVGAGRPGDRSRTLHLVVAESEPEIRSRLAADPWAKASLLVIGSIEPWALWLDGRH